MLTKLLKLSAGFVVALSLTACGFHLKGEGQGSLAVMQQIQLEPNSSTHAALYQTVMRTFKAAGMDADLANDAYTVTLGATQYKASRTSSSAIGEVTSQLLKMSQRFEIIDNTTGKSLLIATPSVIRDRQINTSDILASENELRDIQQSMRVDLARQIQQRVERFLGQRIQQNAKNN